MIYLDSLGTYSTELGYGHSFGMLSHFYGREAGLELREDIDTVLKKYGYINGANDNDTRG